MQQQNQASNPEFNFPEIGTGYLFESHIWLKQNFGYYGSVSREKYWIDC